MMQRENLTVSVLYKIKKKIAKTPRLISIKRNSYFQNALFYASKSGQRTHGKNLVHAYVLKKEHFSYIGQSNDIFLCLFARSGKLLFNI